MPLYPQEKGQLLTLLAKADNAELVSFARLYYESLQQGRFTVEELTLLGRQFYGRLPWEDLNRGVKIPLIRSAQAMLETIAEIFALVPEPVIAAPETPPAAPPDTALPAPAPEPAAAAVPVAAAALPETSETSADSAKEAEKPEASRGEEIPQDLTARAVDVPAGFVSDVVTP